jgi:hypothetical protein
MASPKDARAAPLRDADISRVASPKDARATLLRDADIRAMEPGDPASRTPRGSAAPGTPGLPRASTQAVTADATADALAPFKERWKDLAQRLRASHPPPLPEAVPAQQAAAPAPKPEAPAAPRPAAPRAPGPVPLRARPSEVPATRTGSRPRELVIGNL